MLLSCPLKREIFHLNACYDEIRFVIQQNFSFRITFHEYGILSPRTSIHYSKFHEYGMWNSRDGMLNPTSQPHSGFFYQDNILKRNHVKLNETCILSYVLGNMTNYFIRLPSTMIHYPGPPQPINFISACVWYYEVGARALKSFHTTHQRNLDFS